MNKLQNQFYNIFVDNLKKYYSNDVVNQFQLISPAICLNTSENVWQFQNQIPPVSLNWNNLVSSKNLFFSQYAEAIHSQIPPNDCLKALIGETLYLKWLAHLKEVNPPPKTNKLPHVFSKWAIRNCPSFRNKGISILSRLALYKSSIKRLTPYLPPNEKAVDFSSTIQSIKSQLDTSKALKLTFNSNTAATTIKNDWAAGINHQYFGIWSNSSNLTRLSKKFFNSELIMTISLNKWAKIDFTSGQWYDSNMLHRVYRKKVNWKEEATPNWEDYFGEEGTMKYFSFALLVADGITVKLSSNAAYSEAEKRRVEQNAFNGLWPFYNETMANKIAFDQANCMNVTSTLKGGKPVIIGDFVYDIEQYITA